MTSNNRQQITDNKIFFRVIFYLLLVFCSLFFVRQTQAAVTYPIPELGSCRDANECKLYCDIPAHSPACWSYDKYVLNKDILGETLSPDEEARAHGVTFPISELGNCTSPSECFLYCNQPQNQAACFEFAKKKGLVKEPEKPKPNQEIMETAKKELGCESEFSCMTYCQTPANFDKCQKFARSHNLVASENSADHRGNPSPEIMEKAKAELGCDSETSCMRYCEQGNNMDRCMEFAKKYKLMKNEEIEHGKEMMQKKRQMMEAAKTELGCDSYESCGKICTSSENREKCMNLGRKFGMVKEEVRPQSQSNIPCTSESECKKYCESHPDECPGFSDKSNSFGSVNRLKEDLNKPQTNSNSDTTVSTQINKSNNQKGNFLGPSGCKTEEECRSYCEKHPSECPGFPKTQVSTYPTGYPAAVSYPTQYPPSSLNPTYKPASYPSYPPPNPSGYLK